MKKLKAMPKTNLMAALELKHGKDIRFIVADLAKQCRTQAQLAERLEISTQVLAQWIEKFEKAGARLTLRLEL